MIIIASNTCWYQKQTVDCNVMCRRLSRDWNVWCIDRFFRLSCPNSKNPPWYYRVILYNEHIAAFSGWLVHWVTRYRYRKSSYRWKQNLAFFRCFVANFEQRYLNNHRAVFGDQNIGRKPCIRRTRKYNFYRGCIFF